ncbi:hypothetical protein JAAARDRAFT_200193 [Jaapia argillacea MUCL 33604]|uniref:Uncharacterized protein n=1 Tax=Jaapia argillacea MUCL 33604 TaxID=933084 RepID=A0A067PI86_9AGAM|nr:hypothetical protein JAAARDRAFT_200193 [Jaapia argillacea MUCL 33604]
MGHKGESVPWARLTRDPQMYIDETWLPSSGKVTDPSKMHYKDLKEMLEKIRDTPSDKFDFKVGGNTRKVEKQTSTRGRRKKVKVKDRVVPPTEFDRVDDPSETLEKLQDGKAKRSKARSRKQKPDLRSDTDETDWELAQNGSGVDENSLESTRSQGKKKHQAAVQDVIEVGMTSKAKGKMKAKEDLYDSEHTDWELRRHGSPDEDKRNTECEGKRNEIVAMFSDIDSDSSTPANKKGQPPQVKKTPAGMSKMNKGKAKQKLTPWTALVDDLPGTEADKGKQPIKFPSDDNLPSEVPSGKQLSRQARIESSEESESEPATPVATPVTTLITRPKPRPLANLAMVRWLKEEAGKTCDNATSQAQENGKAVFVPALPTPKPESMKSLMRVPSKLKVQPVKKRPRVEDGEECDPDEPLKKKQHTSQVPLSKKGPPKHIKGVVPKTLPVNHHPVTQSISLVKPQPVASPSRLC